MASRLSGHAALFTPSLLARAATLHADLATVVERSRDLLWWSRQRRRGAPPLGRPISGAADHVEDAAIVLTLILGSSLCLDCITKKSGLSAPRVDALLTTIAGNLTLCVISRATPWRDATASARAAGNAGSSPVCRRADVRSVAD